jgi:hypothetical protein
VSDPRLTVLPPLPPRIQLRRPAERLPFPLEEHGCTLFARARHGIWHGVRALGLAPGDAVLVPAYHHGSEVEALVRAGLAIRFYEGTERLEPESEELDGLLDDRVRALYLIHYAGLPQQGLRWRRWCDERGLLLLEDAAQTWLADVDGRPVGSAGDLAVFCLYKSFGLPDGAALLTQGGVPEPRGKRALGLGSLGRRYLAWAMQRSRTISSVAGKTARPARYSPEDDFALGSPDSPPAATTRWLLPRVAGSAAAARRRANYAALLAELGELVPPPFDRLPDGSSPFALPIASDDKPGLMRRLARCGVAALDFWSVPHPRLPPEGFSGPARRRATTVSLPVHQELRQVDLERIVQAVAERPRSRSLLRPPAAARFVGPGAH